MHVSATDIKNKLGEYLRICARQDVVITKHGREIAVLKGLEDGFMVREESVAYKLADKKHSLERRKGNCSLNSHELTSEMLPSIMYTTTFARNKPATSFFQIL